MTQLEKLIQKFLDRPTSLRYPEIEKVLIKLSFIKIKVRRGSHEKFKHSLLERDLVFPVHDNDCKDRYKIQAVKIITKNKLI